MEVWTVAGVLRGSDDPGDPRHFLSIAMRSEDYPPGPHAVRLVTAPAADIYIMGVYLYSNGYAKDKGLGQFYTDVLAMATLSGTQLGVCAGWSWRRSLGADFPRGHGMTAPVDTVIDPCRMVCVNARASRQDQLSVSHARNNLSILAENLIMANPFREPDYRPDFHLPEVEEVEEPALAHTI